MEWLKWYFWGSDGKGWIGWLFFAALVTILVLFHKESSNRGAESRDKRYLVALGGLIVVHIGLVGLGVISPL